MPLNYYEAFGVRPDSDSAKAAFREKLCPFVNEPCGKKFSNGVVSGSCSLIKSNSEVPIPVCPKRLYGDSYKILEDVVSTAWGTDIPLVLSDSDLPSSGKFVIPFGQNQGHEIQVQHSGRKNSSRFSIDWVLALVDESQNLESFVAVEVQTIDTTGNYRSSFRDLASRFQPSLLRKIPAPPKDSGSFNFENVNKRIIPQLITKGHILRGEELCSRGLYFVCPTAVFDRILQRVGSLPTYPPHPGAITFITYSLDVESSLEPKPLLRDQIYTTTTEQLSIAFSSPKDPPPPGTYEQAIRKALNDRFDTM